MRQMAVGSGTVRVKAISLLLILIAVGLSQNYRAQAIVFDQGGRRISSENYRCGLSLGQQVASPFISGGQYRAVLGFWHPMYGRDTAAGLQEPVVRTAMPYEFALGSCRPNPFQTATQITYVLPRESEVDLRVLDITGRTAAVLVNEHEKAGVYRVTWDVSRIAAARLPGGIYFCRLRAGDFTAKTKVIKLE